MTVTVKGHRSAAQMGVVTHAWSPREHPIADAPPAMRTRLVHVWRSAPATATVKTNRSAALMDVDIPVSPTALRSAVPTQCVGMAPPPSPDKGSAVQLAL